MKNIVLFLCICMQVAGLKAMEPSSNQAPAENKPAEIKFGLPKRTSRPLPDQSPKMPRSPKTEERLQSFSLGRRTSGGNKTLPT